MIARILALVCSLTAAVVFSQAPRLAELYSVETKLAAEHLAERVQDFDEASARAGLTRQAALEQYAATENSFLRERGQKLVETLQQYEEFNNRAAALMAAGPFQKILLVGTGFNREIMERAYEGLEPAVPTERPGLVAGLIGLALGWVLGLVLARLLWKALRGAWSGLKPDRSIPSNP